jgi:tetratricopeptide (TPR) repeat protein
LDSATQAAARALARGDPLAALRVVALRDDPDGLALRGIAMAQLGELPRARELLRGAGQRFGARDRLAWARCVTAELEVALALRDLRPTPRLASAIEALDRLGDRSNAAHARLVDARGLLLRGRVEQAGQRLEEVDMRRASPMLRAIAELVRAEVQLRRLQVERAAEALARARAAAVAAKIPALLAEVERARGQLDAPAATIVRDGRTRAATLGEVEALLRGETLVVDACRRAVGARSLARRPVLFSLARALAEAWPRDATREELVARVFGIRRASDSLRARLRVEVGRLRRVLRDVGRIEATPDGFVLVGPPAGVAVLLPPSEDADAVVLALLADGAAWSTSALALALGVSQRSVQRALGSLHAAGRVHALGDGRSRRWVLPGAIGIATALLLPSTAPAG